TTALRIYRENLPGYKVIGINCNSIIPSLGALHCITKTIGRKQPLWIAHSRLRDQWDTLGLYPLEARIEHTLDIQQATVFYREIQDTTFLSVQMSHTQDNIWRANIPAFEMGSRVEYYIEAVAFNGSGQVRPITGSDGGF